VQGLKTNYYQQIIDFSSNLLHTVDKFMGISAKLTNRCEPFLFYDSTTRQPTTRIA